MAKFFRAGRTASLFLLVWILLLAGCGEEDRSGHGTVPSNESGGPTFDQRDYKSTSEPALEIEEPVVPSCGNAGPPSGPCEQRTPDMHVPARGIVQLTEANGDSLSVPVETGPSEPVGKVGDMPTPSCEPSEASPGLCEERDVATFRLFSFDEVGAAFPADEGTDSVEEVLEKGLALAEVSPVHLAFRGTGQNDSTRCQWRGIARTPNQREAAIRHWLGLDADAPIPSPSELETQFMSYVDNMDPLFIDSMRANFRILSRGGLSTEYVFLTCFVDYTVNEYLLGPSLSSAATLTVAYDRLGEARSYDLYQRSHANGRFGTQSLLSEGEYQAVLDQTIWDTESVLSGIVEGHESVVFLAPMGAHNAIAIEAWQAVAQWDLQTGSGGVINAVRYGGSSESSEHTQPFTELVSRVATSAATDAFAGQRIENADGLDDYYDDIGATGDITPGDGSTVVFTPAQPPPILPIAYTCASGTTVSDPGNNRPLVQDCEVLIAARDGLAGTTTLDWSTGTVITSWEGVTTGGSPTRVTELDLSGKSLTGKIPAALGSLSALTHLDLSGNSLTGEIPSELALLFNLEEVRLSGNSLTGCIPIALEAVPTNDLDMLNLLYCAPPMPENVEVTTTGGSSIGLDWNSVANSSWYRVEFRVHGDSEWTTNSNAVSSTSYTVEAIDCGTAHQFRVNAFGSGTTYAGDWSEPSDVVTNATSECAAPVFDATSYDLSVVLDSGVGTIIGDVTALDSADDTVSYEITAGDDDGLFSIDESSGRITLATAVDSNTITPLTLTVEARDGNDNAATMVVTVAITAMDYTALCSNGTVIVNPSAVPDLVRDCAVLLAIKDTLAGEGTLNWSASRFIDDWDGLTFHVQDTVRLWISKLKLTDKGLTGTVPSQLGQVLKLESLYLNQNQLTGNVPSELGQLTLLEYLNISRNQLDGEVPSSLGELTSLQSLSLSRNQLTGEIPSELGRLTDPLF